MENEELEPLADALLQAQETGVPCEPLTAHKEDLTVSEAYDIQLRNIRQRNRMGLHGRPARLVGRKIGITSKAVQGWLNVSEPDFGCLLDDMMVTHGETAPIQLMLQPRVEGEIAFVLKRDLEGPGVTPLDVITATDYLLPALEIIDSRVADWKIKYEDTIADNASSGFFVLGNQPKSIRDVDLDLCGLALLQNGRVKSTGAGLACLGDPVHAVVWLANALGKMGTGIKAGEVILSGALGPVIPVSQGDHIEARISGLGNVACRFDEEEWRK
jgi:2-oxopent-4-enoate hydratase